MEKIKGKYTLEQAKDIQRFVDEQSISTKEIIDNELAFYIYNDVFENEQLGVDSFVDNEDNGLFTIFLFKKIDSPEFDRLIDTYQYIRETFPKEIYTSIRLKPSIQISSLDIGNSKFYNSFNMNNQEFILHSVPLTKEIDSPHILKK